MQILDKAITPDGIEIELHDLSGENRNVWSLLHKR